MAPAKPRLMILGGPDVDARLELMDRLASDFELAAIGSSKEIAARFDGRYPYFDYPMSRGYDLLADRHSVAALQPLLAGWQPDIVHCFDTKPCVIGRLAARRSRVPVIIGTQPGLGALYTYDTPQIHQRREVFRRLQTLACRHSSLTLFYTAEDRQIFVDRQIVAADHCRVIDGSGVSADRFAKVAENPGHRAAIRHRLGLAAGDRMVLSVARLIRAKGVLDLAEAAAAIHEACPTSQIWLAGGRETEALDRLTEREFRTLGKRLRWLGQREDIPDLLAAADVFVLPTYYREGIPRALIEAAFAGVPLVATDNVGCREVVADRRTGLRIPPRQPRALAEAVIQLLDDPQTAARYARQARRLAMERFELGRIATQLSEIYRELLGR